MPKGVKPVNARVDKAAALISKLKGKTYKQIADDFGVTPQAVHKNITHIIKYLHDPAVDEYKQNKLKVLTAIEMAHANNLLNPDTIQKASANNSAYSMIQAFTARRLEEGLSTANVDMHSRIADVNASIQALKNLIDNDPDK